MFLVWRHVKAVLRLGRLISKTYQMFGRISRPHQGDTVSPRRGLKFPATIDARQGIAADSQQKTANNRRWMTQGLFSVYYFALKIHIRDKGEKYAVEKTSL